jgi:hypothetical protein
MWIVDSLFAVIILKQRNYQSAVFVVGDSSTIVAFCRQVL